MKNKKKYFWAKLKAQQILEILSGFIILLSLLSLFLISFSILWVIYTSIIKLLF